MNYTNDMLSALETFQFVDLPKPGWGRVYFTSFPGLQLGHDGTAYLDPNDMDRMLSAFQEAQVDLLIILPKGSELPDLAMSQLLMALADKEIQACELPVSDFNIPSQSGMEIWKGLLPNISEILASGRSIGFCCLAGLGRSPMFAARTLCEFGISQDEAVQAIRQKNPLAIETPEQARWAGQVR